MQPVRKKILLAFMAMFLLSACNTSDTGQSFDDSAGVVHSDQDGSMMEGDWTEEEMEKMMEEGHSIEMESADSQVPQDELATQTNGRYITYSAQAAEELTASGNPYALFFHADWCPNCKKLDEEIKVNFDSFPGSVTIFKTDFDTELELRKKYGVTMQHTLVHIDVNGEVTEAIPGFTLDDVKRVFAQ